MHVACRFTGDKVAYTLPSCNRPSPTVHNYSPLSFEPLGATITRQTPFTSHSIQPWTILSPSPPISSAACSSFASSSIDLRFPPLLPPIDQLRNQFCRGAVPKRPTPVLHLQLSIWSLLLVTVYTASTNLLVPAGFLTQYNTDKQVYSIAQVGRQSQNHTQQLTHTLQSSRQLPKHVAHYRMIQVVQCNYPNATRLI